MTFANVNIGSYAGDNTGDPLRTAFDKINKNFANITAGNISVTLNAPVMSVAGRTGNIVLNVNDVSGAVGLGRLNSTVNAANVAANAYTDAAISNLVNGAPLALDTLLELAEQLNDDTSAIAAITTSLNQTTINQNAANVLVYALGARVDSVELTNNAQAVSINTLTSNASAQSLELNRINANVTAANSAINSLQVASADHANSITDLEANAATQAYSLFVLTGNAAMQHTAIGELRANITAANAVIAEHTSQISSLLSNAASQASDLITLTANASVQSSDIATLVANAAAQATSLTTLTANAASQAGDLTTLIANAASQAGDLTTLIANAAVQGESLEILFSNAVAQTETLTSLIGNAITQAESIDSINANVASANIAISDLQSQVYTDVNTQAYLDAVVGNVIPSTDITYDLGSPTNRWKDLYLSGSTIYIGNASISATTTGGISVPGGINGGYPLIGFAKSNNTYDEIAINGGRTFDYGLYSGSGVNPGWTNGVTIIGDIELSYPNIVRPVCDYTTDINGNIATITVTTPGYHYPGDQMVLMETPDGELSVDTGFLWFGPNRSEVFTITGIDESKRLFQVLGESYATAGGFTVDFDTLTATGSAVATGVFGGLTYELTFGLKWVNGGLKNGGLGWGLEVDASTSTLTIDGGNTVTAGHLQSTGLNGSFYLFFNVDTSSWELHPYSSNINWLIESGEVDVYIAFDKELSLGTFYPLFAPLTSVQAIGDSSVTGNLNVSGNNTVTGDLVVTGNTVIEGNLTVSPTTIFMGSLAMSAPSGDLELNNGIKVNSTADLNIVYANSELTVANSIRTYKIDTDTDGIDSYANLAITSAGNVAVTSGIDGNISLSTSGTGLVVVPNGGIQLPDGTVLTTVSQADFGNIVFTDNTIGSADGSGGITINASGTGEVVISDNLGVNNINPAYLIDIGNINENENTGAIGINFNNNVESVGHRYGSALIGWDWWDQNGHGTNNDGTEHYRFGIYNGNAAPFSHAWLSFDKDAPADSIHVNELGTVIVRKTVSNTIKSNVQVRHTEIESNNPNSVEAIDLITGVQWIHTANTSQNFEFNIRGNSTTTLDSFLGVGETVTVQYTVTNGNPAYYLTGVQIDGVTQTVKWLNGSTPSSGTVDGYDLYNFFLTKVSANTYVVLGQQQKYS